MKLVDTVSQAILDVHCSTNREGSDVDLAEQIARVPAGDLRSLVAYKSYDKQSLREGLRDLGIGSLIWYHIFYRTTTHIALGSTIIATISAL